MHFVFLPPRYQSGTKNKVPNLSYWRRLIIAYDGIRPQELKLRGIAQLR